MKNIFLSVLLFFSFAKGIYGAVIENNYVSMGRNGTSYNLEVIQNPITNDFTGIFFEYNNGMLLNPTVNVDEGSDWYLVSSDNQFNSATIAAGLFPVFVRLPTSGSAILNNITPTSANFFLAFNTGVSFTDPEYRNIFGWVYLSDLNGVLTLEKSAITYTDGGIVVGTPLPTSALFFASSLLFLVSFIRKHSKKEHPTVFLKTVTI